MQVHEKVVKLCSCDGHVYELPHDVLEMCATLRSILRGKTAFKNGLGGLFSVDNGFVVLKSEGKILASIVKNTSEEIYLSFPDVKAEVLERVFEYCKYQTLGHTEREKRLWEAEYVQIKQGLLCEVASAAYYLDIKPLVNLTSRAIASQISTKTSEELRETFSNVNCDLYVPMFATRCRLHRKMAQKKSVKGIQPDGTETNSPLYNHPTCTHPPSAPHTVECCTLPLPPAAPQQTPSLSPTSSTTPTPTALTESHDTRSLDELLEFIGDDGKSSKKGKKKSKKAKGKKEKENVEQSKQKSGKQQSKEPVPPTIEEEEEEEATTTEEEELSPEIQAEIDREVEEFRLRLESISCNKRTIPKITLPSAISASLSSLQVY
eukprot:Phypoly_transcript_08841.p1 GENE.Phypoly_transcript_08841~~Phypoly_transcript_08841.p1  ORF type:complete len:377 (+),score=86.94 Phypoly_transcript_08841:73-1203(+)